MPIIKEGQTLLALTEKALGPLDGIEANLLFIEENVADRDADAGTRVFLSCSFNKKWHWC